MRQLFTITFLFLLCVTQESRGDAWNQTLGEHFKALESANRNDATCTLYRLQGLVSNAEHQSIVMEGWVRLGHTTRADSLLDAWSGEELFDEYLNMLARTQSWDHLLRVLQNEAAGDRNYDQQFAKTYEALDSLAQALKYYRFSADLKSQARVLSNMGFEKDALTLLDKSSSRQKEKSEELLELHAQLCETNGDLERAMEMRKEQIDRYSKSQNLYDLARLQLLTGDTISAIVNMRNARKRGLSNPELFLQLFSLSRPGENLHPDDQLVTIWSLGVLSALAERKRIQSSMLQGQRVQGKTRTASRIDMVLQNLIAAGSEKLGALEYRQALESAARRNPASKHLALALLIETQRIGDKKSAELWSGRLLKIDSDWPPARAEIVKNLKLSGNKAELESMLLHWLSRGKADSTLYSDLEDLFGSARRSELIDLLKAQPGLRRDAQMRRELGRLQNKENIQP
jgi:tetratricopeptide (TPR) repeat protein